MSNSQLITSRIVSSLENSAEDQEKVFWQQWEKYQDHLYHCCLKWMGGNPIHAEEALSRAMLKAWEKVRNGTVTIDNFKAWLIQLTYNLCMDIHRENKRGNFKVKSLDAIAETEEVELVFQFNTPESAAMQDELKTMIHCAIEDLPSRLREPFTLHFILEKSYQDITQELGISYNNLCQRISQAREILQQRLRSYLLGLDDSQLDSSTASGKREKSGVEKFLCGTIAPEAMIPSTFSKKKYFDSCPNYYQVTAICLETVPHAWYQSPSPLGWN
ncbi:RNA polymerase sigma factor [Floridanema aerugineum]|uniref:RNA polymerase sigma factor n=1 Tax=Floridaenema aerugineum BLCC-F46 TaxID=3153654 RepID=A0ABV4XG65_9CYAN